MSTEEKRIQELEEELKTIDNAVLKSALEKELEQAKADAEAKMINRFKRGREILKNVVNELQSIRELEKRNKAKVIAIDKAFQQLKADGDWDAFKTNCKTVSYWF